MHPNGKPGPLPGKCGGEGECPWIRVGTTSRAPFEPDGWTVGGSDGSGGPEGVVEA